MNTQISLLDPQEPAEQNLNLFFAVLPNSESVVKVAELLTQLRQKHLLTGNAVKPEQLHVSIFNLGDHKERPEKKFIDMAHRAGESVQMPPVEFIFDLAVSFRKPGAPKPFVLHGSKASVAFKALEQQLGYEMIKAGLGNWVKPVSTPHLTLLYDRKDVPQQNIAPVQVTSQELALVLSFVGDTRYEILQSWPLKAA